MVFQEIDLFKGLGPQFMNEIADAAEDRILPADAVLFNRGEAADYLYVLKKGRIRLFFQEAGSINFVVDKPGEIIGWSALVEPNIYSVSAQSYEDCQVLRFERTRLERVFEKYPKEAHLVMKRLAGVVGQRLANSYQELLRSHTRQDVPSYG